MSPITHFLASWTVANALPLGKRDRMAVTLVGTLPDIDGVGMLVELATRNTDTPLLWFEDYHRVLGHNLTFGLFCSLIALAVCWKSNRWKTFGLALFAFHVHICCDIIGGRGPDGSLWPMVYFWPFEDSVRLMWNGAWYLNAWPNFVITGVLLLLTFYLVLRKGFSPLEMLSTKADSAFVRTLQQRFSVTVVDRPAKDASPDEQTGS